MTIKHTLLLLILFMLSCGKKKTSQPSNFISIEGTWKLISATTIKEDSIIPSDLSNKSVIKIINASHFAFLNHDLNQGKDSLSFFASGGGKYKLKDNKYTEFLEYCNFRNWEGNIFEFTVEIHGDTLIQRGFEKVQDAGTDHEIIETYLRTN
ncbi:lipocalin-like domain-containing protein [Aestuariibaculum suncheonense]|uniref:Lipocalin-like domain-containing protein n=1 Tax=Aestuariibaculum suncheonense TaxID=1028745 RepID=A0A8J6Q6T3_9FLAO|nr:lipocalin-like domain-containing protein [Aestuariibaculum suncheonense]MBD0835061.1 lipocalin-like domain-containing protein [Aestuariibaculum suncheonense]